MRDEVVGKSIFTWLLRIFKLLRCTHRATALKESSESIFNIVAVRSAICAPEDLATIKHRNSCASVDSGFWHLGKPRTAASGSNPVPEGSTRPPHVELSRPGCRKVLRMIYGC